MKAIFACLLLLFAKEHRVYALRHVLKVKNSPNSVQTIGYGVMREEWRGEVVQMSWSPRLYLLKQFLSIEECDHLKSQASSRMRNSTVVDNTGRNIPSHVRTSSGMFLPKDFDTTMRSIERRISHVTMLPVENQEDLQILHYHDGQKYDPHLDFFTDAWNMRLQAGGQRIVTFLMYLSTVEEGGETVFPSALQDDLNHEPEWPCCAQSGLSVKAVKGDAIMFYGLDPGGNLDQRSLHGSCPTLKGDKWSATKWIRVKEVQTFNLFGPFSSTFRSWMFYFFSIM